MLRRNNRRKHATLISKLRKAVREEGPVRGVRGSARYAAELSHLRAEEECGERREA